MINTIGIYNKAKSYVNEHETRNPLLIAKYLNIVVLKREFGDLLGAYQICLKQPFIFLNHNLDDVTERMVVAHELGHYALHKEVNFFKELSNFNLKDNTEYEANAFTAHLLIDDDEVVEYINDGYD